MAGSIFNPAPPAIYGNNHTEIYYNIAESLPDSLPSNVANQKLEEDFDMSNMHMILMDKNMDGLEKQNMLSEVDKIDGVKWSLNMNSLIGPSIPDSMIPDDIKKCCKVTTMSLRLSVLNTVPQLQKLINRLLQSIKS